VLNSNLPYKEGTELTVRNPTPCSHQAALLTVLGVSHLDQLKLLFWEYRLLTAL